MDVYHAIDSALRAIPINTYYYQIQDVLKYAGDRLLTETRPQFLLIYPKSQDPILRLSS